MSETNRCHGIKADGTRCGATRMTDFAKKSHLVSPSPWYCHRHKDPEAKTS